MTIARLAAHAATLALLLASGCTTIATDDEDDSDDGGNGPAGIPVLGNNEHTPDAVSLATISSPTDGLSVPRDAQFNPMSPNDLWVVNRATNAVVIYTNAGTDAQAVVAPTEFGADHFLVQPSSLAMGNTGFFATIHETDDKTQGINGTPADFMGPTLWSSDMALYGGGHATHYDMLHNSPNGMGIAWQYDNVYWVFDGYHSAITMYDFRSDHGPGQEDHSDAVVRRYVEGEVLWVENVPSHMVFHPTNPNLLLVADTGNNRIAALDITTGTQGLSVVPNYDGSDQKVVNGAALTTLIDGAAVGMSLPSGIAVHNGVIYVSDAATSVIWGFSLEGETLDWLETGLPSGSTLGLELNAAGELFTTDAATNAVWKISPL